MAGRSYDPFSRVHAREANKTPEQRAVERAAAKLSLLKPVATAPVKGDPELIDWESHECGYAPQSCGRNGKPIQSGPNADPAWRWTEEPGRGGKPCLRTVVQDLALKVYRIGYRHNNVEVYNHGGFPDDMYWGPGGLIIRELKAMRPDWKRGQKQHLLSLHEARQDVAVWFPCCLLSGLIDEEMAAIAQVEPKGTYARRHRGQPNRPLTWKEVADGALR